MPRYGIAVTGDTARCKHCPANTNLIQFDKSQQIWWHKQRLNSVCPHEAIPDNVWRIFGIFGPRADGRRYYEFRNYGADGSPTYLVQYKWDSDFWFPANVFEKMSKVRPMYNVSPLGTPGY